MTEKNVDDFISRLKTKILQDVGADASRPIAIMVIPGAYNPIHKGHLAMFDKAYKELISKKPDTLIYGVYVASTDVYIASKLNTTKSTSSDIDLVKKYSTSGELITSLTRIQLCNDAIIDYTSKNAGYANKIYTYPVEYGGGDEVLKSIITQLDPSSNYKITGYIVCGSDHIYNTTDLNKGSYLWETDVIAIVRKNDVDAIKKAIITKENFDGNMLNLLERWSDKGKTITFVYPVDADEDAGTSSTKVRNLYKLLKMDASDSSVLLCEQAKDELKKLLTDRVYTWVMTNLMAKTQPTCKEEIIPAARVETETGVSGTGTGIASVKAIEGSTGPAAEAETTAESVAPVLVPSNYFISIHFKTDDQWTFYRCLMRGYLISTYIASHEAPDADADDDAATDKALLKSQIRRAMYNSAESVLHADNVFHFDDVIISEYDAIIGMLTRMSRWFKFKLDQSVPRKAISSVEDGSALMSTADYFVHQLDAAFKVVDTGSEQSTMSINEFMNDLTADIDNANSSKVLAAWDATGRAVRNAATATRRAPGAAWTATKSAASSVADAVSKRASQANTTRKNVSASVDNSVAESAESFAARRRTVANASAAAAAKADGGRQVARQQMKQMGGAPSDKFAGTMTKLKQYVGDDGAPANKPAMLADEYFERLSKIVAGVSRPSIFGHPLLLYLPFARAFNCIIYVYKPSQTDNGNYILKYIFRGAEAEAEEVEEGEEGEEEVAHAKEVHEIHILDKNPDGDGSAFLDDVESYSSRFALLVLSGTHGTVGSDSIATGATSTGVANSTDASSGLLSTSTNVSPHVKTDDASVPVIADKSKSDAVIKPTTPPPSLSGVHDNDIIIYNKYDVQNPSGDTSIGAESFYSKLANSSGTNLQNIKVYLTNGANDEVLCRIKIKTDNDGKNILDAAGNEQYEGDGGTSGAFAKMALNKKINDLCVPDRYVNVFNPNDKTFHADITTLINDSTQVAKVKVDTKTTTYPAGSVFKLVINSPLTNKNYPVYGAYHIKGIKWGGVVAATPNETMSVHLVKAYYTAILDDVLKNEATENDKTYIVHLAQIPGALFGGTKITGDAMHEAVNEWIVKNSDIIASKKTQTIGIQISIDYLKPAPLAKLAPAPAPVVVVAKTAITPPKPVPKVDPNSIRVMTFNTCWEALDAKASGTLDMMHCGTTPNTCRSNINTVIKKGITDKYDFILLQEMTSDFDTVLVGTAKKTATKTSEFKNVVEYEFANGLYTGYGYKFLLGRSNMGILSLKKADTVVVGNLSAIPYDRPPAVIHGGDRPFMILVFTADKRIVMNVHAPQPRKFKNKSKKMDYTEPEILQKIDEAEAAITISKSDIDNKQVISQYRDMQEYAFSYVIPNAIQTKLGLSIEDLKTYQFIIAGDFNRIDPQIGLNGLNQKIDGKSVSGLPFLNYFPAPDGNVLTGKKDITCAHPYNKTPLTKNIILKDYKNGALSDHILSNMEMETDSYKIFDGKIDGADIHGILKTPPEFSDHLPVYATITSEKKD